MSALEQGTSLYSYKTYERAGRLQNIEDSIAHGMQVTNAPLPEGYAKVLVNYDISNNGDALKSRPGLRVSEVLVPSAEDASSTPALITGKEQIVAVKEQKVGNYTIPQFFIKPEITADAVLNDGPLYMATGTTQAPTKKLFDGLQEQTYNLLKYDHANYVIPDKAEIHGLPLIDRNPIARQVGCYAWNNNYYFLNGSQDKLVHTEFDPDTSKYKFVESDPKQITPKDAVTYGYNMLAPDPYKFTNRLTASETHISFNGMLPYDANDKLQLTPVVNQSLKFVAYYTAPASSELKITWEWRSLTDSAWTKLKEETKTVTVSDSTSTEISVTFSPPAESILMRVIAAPATSENNLALATLAVGFNFKKGDYGATANIQVKNYDLFSSTGMCFWKNRLILWGAKDADNILFASDVNDPTYFPYPNNTDTFDGPIKFAVPFLDYLLVFTATTLYMCTLSEDGLSWTHKVLQSNLTIADWDIHLIQVVKNMVFFRSGNYFYMVVPKRTSMTGELTIASISKPLFRFFDSFIENVAYILNSTYHRVYQDLELVHYYDYLDFEDVHVCYVFKDPYATTAESYIIFCMLYNTTARSWRAYVLGSTKPLMPYAQDATQKGQYCSMTVAQDKSLTKLVIELLNFNTVNCKDFYLTWRTNCKDYIQDFESNRVVYNWQCIDTGYRDHNANFKKRYRELQFIINNLSYQALDFYTDFYIDGEPRSPWFKYVVHHDTNPKSPNYGLITVERELTDPKQVPGTTILAENAQETKRWQLDVSEFPGHAIFKVRFPVSGKGYTPRLVIASQNELSYELLNISWIYRAMYSR